MSKSVPQLTEKTDSEDADLFHIVRSSVDYKTTKATLFDDLRFSNFASDYDAGTSYEVANPPSKKYAMYNGILWKFIGASPATGVTPGTDATKWEKTYCAELAHYVGEDTLLAQGTADEVTAADIRLHLDEFKSVKLELTAAQVKDLYNTPVGLVTGSMVAAGQAVELISASLFLDYGTAAFGNINIYLGHAAAPQRQMETGLGVMNATADKFINFANTANGGLTQVIEDTAIVVGASAVSATGDSPVTIYAFYRIITL